MQRSHFLSTQLPVRNLMLLWCICSLWTRIDHQELKYSTGFPQLTFVAFWCVCGVADDSVLARVIIAVLHQCDQSNLGRVYISWLIVLWGKPRQGLKVGRNLQEGGDAEAVEDGCLMACLLHLAQPALKKNRTLRKTNKPNKKNPKLPAQGWHHSQWAAPLPINH